MEQDPKKMQSFPLRIPASTRQAAAEFARQDGVSLNYFISMAITEKIGRMERVRSRMNPVSPISAARDGRPYARRQDGHGTVSLEDAKAAH
jgi:hypothetical protein